MSKTLIAKSTFIAASTLLLASLSGMPPVKAAEQGMTASGAADAHEQARRLLRRPDITASGSAVTLPASCIARSPVPDAHEQARRLLSRPAAVAECTGFEAAALILKPEAADGHTLAEHLLLKL